MSAREFKGGDKLHPYAMVNLKVYTPIDSLN